MRSIIHCSAFVGMVAAFSIACSSGSSGNFSGQGGGDDGGETTSSSSGGATGSSGGGSGGSSSSTFNESSGGGMGNGTCKTGEYAGSFTCEFFYGDSGGADAAADSGLLSINGTLSFALTQNETAGVGEGTGTDIAMGTFAAATGGFIAASADLDGTLNCSQGIFTGSLTNGDYGLNVNGMPVSGAGNTFMGPFDSDYNGTTAAFVNGTWSMAIAGEGTCSGTWTAAYTGPLDAGIADASGQ